MRQKILSSDREFTIDSYNAQLIRHNKLYSKVVSEFITNSEMIIQHLHNLPHHEVVNQLTTEAAKINNRFGLMQNQFSSYQKDVKKYSDYLKQIVKERDDKRNEGNPDNEANKEQKEIIDSIAQV